MINKEFIKVHLLNLSIKIFKFYLFINSRIFFNFKFKLKKLKVFS